MLVLFSFYIFSYFSAPPLLRTFFFNIGQGDSAFIDTPGHFQILIDAGPSEKVLRKLNRVLPFFDRTIDMLVLTHPERDHISGLVYVLRHFRVKAVIMTGIFKYSPEYRAFLKELGQQNVLLIKAVAGERFQISKDLSLSILYPFQNYENLPGRSVNFSSVVAKISYKEVSLLFTGDIEKNQEEEIVVHYPDCLRSNVLKVAHHGSKTSSSEEFLAAVFPQLAVVSVGRNNYGQPSPKILDRLSEYAKVFRTDRDGDIEVLSDGENIWVKKFDF